MKKALFFMAGVYFCLAGLVHADGPPKMVVVPFYAEGGRAVLQKDAVDHQRRVIRLINNQLGRHDFTVINPFAGEASGGAFEWAGEISGRSSAGICKRFGADAAYMIRLEVRARRSADGYYVATVIFDGEGYDSRGHDLGMGVARAFKAVRRDRGQAILAAEKRVGVFMGLKLNAWSDRLHSGVISQN